MNKEDNDKEFSDALDRIANAPEGEVDDQVNREIIRYWNEKVSNSPSEGELVMNRTVRKMLLKDGLAQNEASELALEYPEIERGTLLHNRQINKSGVALEVQEDSRIVVMTVDGKERWHPENCDLIEDSE